jgi:hypothetical protein
LAVVLAFDAFLYDDVALLIYFIICVVYLTLVVDALVGRDVLVDVVAFALVLLRIIAIVGGVAIPILAQAIRFA